MIVAGIPRKVFAGLKGRPWDKRVNGMRSLAIALAFRRFRHFGMAFAVIETQNDFIICPYHEVGRYEGRIITHTHE